VALLLAPRVGLVPIAASAGVQLIVTTGRRGARVLCAYVAQSAAEGFLNPLSGRVLLAV
jgi:hypothetical protein